MQADANNSFFGGLGVLKQIKLVRLDAEDLLSVNESTIIGKLMIVFLFHKRKGRNEVQHETNDVHKLVDNARA